MELCLKVGPCLFWINFQVEVETWTCNHVKSDNYKFKFQLELHNESKTRHKTHAPPT